MIQIGYFVLINWLLSVIFIQIILFCVIITDKMIQKAQFVSNKGKL
jgi:hypothetical protein